MPFQFWYGVWILNFAAAQAPARSVARNGNCRQFTPDLLTGRGINGASGLLALSLFQRTYEDRDPVRITIYEYRIICETQGTVRGTYTSVSLIIRFTCTGTICDGTVNTTRTGIFSYRCDPATPNYMFANSVYVEGDRSISDLPSQAVQCGDCAHIGASGEKISGCFSTYYGQVVSCLKVTIIF